MLKILAAAVIAILAVTAAADVLVKKDGTRLEGDLRRTDGGWEVVSADGKITQVGASDVRSIELGGKNGPASGPASAGGSTGGGSSAATLLASLRRSVEALPDIDQVIQRYQRFIDSTKDPAVIDDARKDLAMWQDRRDRGLIKHGGKWVTPGEAADMMAAANVAAENARTLLRSGKQVEAEQAIADALEQDPASASALYLRGVVLYRADKLTDARKAFEAVGVQIERHGPTLNNLGVIMWRQKATGGALNLFDQAMQAAPVNKYILDNVADVLGTLPENERKNAVAQKVARRFTEQDTVLQQQMAAQGWYRWGSTWVDQKTLDALREQEKAARAKMAAMQSEFDQANARITRIDQEIRDNERAMNDLRASTIIRGSDGKLQYFPLPASYYEYQRRNQDLKNEQAALAARLDTLRAEAQHAQQELPVPRFTGVQQIVGVEGMPTPASQPPPTTAGAKSGD